MSRLHTGDLAPDLELPTWKHERVSLAELRGRPVWLGFYRYASCPMCNLQIHQIQKRYGSLGPERLSVLAVFQSSPARMAEYVGKQEPDITLLCDPDEASYGAYGLEASAAGFASVRLAGRLAKAATLGYVGLPRPDGTLTRLPADFLIDEEGRIEAAFYARDISDHIPFEEVDAFLARRGTPNRG